MIIQTSSKIEQVRQAILMEILAGRLRPGQRLLESALSKEVGVSQATVNAALAEDHQVLIRAMQAGPEEAARATRVRIEQWLSHSLSALEHVASMSAETT